MLAAIFFGLFVGTMVKETHIQSVCKPKLTHHKEIKKLCSKQLHVKIEKLEKKLDGLK